MTCFAKPGFYCKPNRPRKSEALNTVMASHIAVSSVNLPGSIERRSGTRFPLELPVRYRSSGPRRRVSGTGWVVNISSGGVLVASQNEVYTGTRMDLSIEWPSLLDGRVPLRLAMVATVVRSGLSSFAVVVIRYQFRTTKRTITPIDAPFGDARMQQAKKVASA